MAAWEARRARAAGQRPSRPVGSAELGPARDAWSPRRVAATRRAAHDGGPRGWPGPARARQRPTQRSRRGRWRRTAPRRPRPPAPCQARAIAAAAAAGVGDLGDVLEQTAALVG